MMQENYFCRLQPEEVERRRRDDHILKQRLQSVDREEIRANLTFPAELEPRVRQFAREESVCCPFFDFHVRRGETSVTLTVTAPGDAGHMVDALVDEFRSEAG